MSDSVNSVTNFLVATSMAGGQGPNQEEVLTSNLRGALRELINGLDFDNPVEAIAHVVKVAAASGMKNLFIKRKAPLHKLTRHRFINELQKIKNEVRVHSMSSMLVYH
jgi:hypothetical protein